MPHSSNPQPTIPAYVAQSTNSPYQLQLGSAGGTQVYTPESAFVIGIASTTPFVSSTTGAYIEAPWGVQVNSIACPIQPLGATAEIEWFFTNPAGVQSTPFYFNASSTGGFTAISSNNVLTKGATTTIIVGNTTGNVTQSFCTFNATTTPV
jgi:hypothetical protein